VTIDPRTLANTLADFGAPSPRRKRRIANTQPRPGPALGRRTLPPAPEIQTTRGASFQPGHLKRGKEKVA
jgi:hypothetical protein